MVLFPDDISRMTVPSTEQPLVIEINLPPVQRDARGLPVRFNHDLLMPLLEKMQDQSYAIVLESTLAASKKFFESASIFSPGIWITGIATGTVVLITLFGLFWILSIH